MSKKIPSLRSPLGRARGMGSAKFGTEHWWHQRLTAIALVILSTYVVTTFFCAVVMGDYMMAIEWLKSPLSATFFILFILVGFHHAAAGMQVVIEDYMHCESAKLTAVIATKFIASAFALLGTLAVIKILLGV